MSLEILEQDPTDSDFVQNPYAFYQNMRAKGDFVFWTDYNMEVATTHEAVTEVLRNRALGREIPEDKLLTPRPELAAFEKVDAHSMLELEPPTHTRLRSLVLRAFTRNRIHTLAPEISRVADDLISNVPSGHFDLLEEFARPLPAIIIARLLGVPVEMVPNLLDWSNRMVAMYQARRTPEIEHDASEAAGEFSAYLQDFIKMRRGAPENDLISELIAAEEDGARLSMDELISTCILLLNAGHEATVHSIGNAFVHLVDFNGRGDALLPASIQGTVEECLRYDPPLHLFTRQVYAPVEICGQRFEKGAEIGCLLGSATRDDAVWPDGEVFDPFRPVRPNTAFGAGVHFCVGAPLARLELQIALPILFARCPDICLVEPPKIANLYHFRGREKLMTTCTSGG